MERILIEFSKVVVEDEDKLYLAKLMAEREIPDNNKYDAFIERLRANETSRSHADTIDRILGHHRSQE